MTAVQHAGTIHSETAVLQRLADLADEHLSWCLAALEQMIRLPGDSWRLHAGKEHLETVLRRGVAGDDVDRDTSRRLISVLALEHGVKLLHLLRDADES